MEYVGTHSLYTYLKQFDHRRIEESEAKVVFK